MPANADQLIIEPEMGRAPILSAINSAKNSLNLVMYGFTDKTVLNSIIKKKDNGLKLKVILERKPYKAENENKETIKAFKRNNINWEGDVPPYQYIHQKTLLTDNNRAIVMTFNFTNSTYHNARNFGLIIDNKIDVGEIIDHFSSDWRHQPTYGTSKHLIWSPDDSREKINTLIKQASKSLNIYASSIQDDKIIAEIVRSAKSGVEIKILTTKKLQKKLADTFNKAGVEVHYDNKHLIHAKIIIVDSKKAVIGSANLTVASLDKNRELSVISEDRAVINQLLEIFHKDWQESNL